MPSPRCWNETRHGRPRIFGLGLIAVLSALPLAAQTAGSVSFHGKSDAIGKRIVRIAGDESYRSEETLVQLAKILAVRHDCTCTVLFSIGADGTIDPNAKRSLSNPAALSTADAIIMAVRFREWPDDAMEHFVAAYLAGKPIVAAADQHPCFQVFRSFLVTVP